jgi:spoIIIJ-associated protein
MTELDESDRDRETGPPTDAEGAVEALEDLLAEIADGLGLEVEVEVEQTDEALTGRLEGHDVGLFIGRRGQTIDAVQHLAQRIVFHDAPSPVRVVIDADGYRERRAQALRADAADAADEVAQTGRAIELDPMPASERRVVHEYLRDREDIETHSEGDEPDRYLVITPAAGPASSAHPAVD